MKTLNLLAAICFAVFFSTMGFGQITGSAHDFTTKSWNASGEMCNACHTPHNSLTIADAPLWDHQVTVATFTLYTSPSMDATFGVGAQPSGSSKLCLSCHDGTVALDNFGGVTTGTNFIAGVGNVGNDLANDHPVSFTYDAALATADGGLFNPTTVNSGLGGTITADLLYAGKVECSSCHDVHRGGSATGKLLVKSNAASALCLTCHDK